MKFRLVPCLAALCLAGMPLSADVVRSATGQRRVELEKMELRAFPADAWSKLTAWSGGDALTAAATKDKPVLIMTWASWHPASLKALAIAQRMADTYGPNGLIVVGVHHAQGWDEAAEAAKSHGAKFLMGHDSAGGFRKALKIDHDPDFYVIDRAGQLRYAAVASQSVDEACSTVVGETAQQATDLPGQLRQKAASEVAAGQKTETIKGSLERIPGVPPGFTKPGDEAYKDASWPKVSEKAGKDYGLLDQDGKPIAPKFDMKPAGYFPTRPETVGRVMVVYTFHPELLASFDKVLPAMDQLQVQMGRDVAVIGALVPPGKMDQSKANQPGQAGETPEKVQTRVKDFLASRQFKHALAADTNGTSITSLAGLGRIQPSIPFVIIVSSDGLVRWAGNPLSSDFKYALETVLANDPGVAARRAADEKYIRGDK